MQSLNGLKVPGVSGKQKESVPSGAVIQGGGVRKANEEAGRKCATCKEAHLDYSNLGCYSKSSGRQ